MIAPTAEILTGQSETHLLPIEELGIRLHREALGPFVELREAARKDGFDIRATSAFRGFATQLLGWNRKATGERPILDSDSQPIPRDSLSRAEAVRAILRWFMIPGGSRHHWGTDIDVFDKNALPDPSYRVQLISAEVEAGGPFAPLHDWLDEHAQRYGFFRPYARDLGGVAPERWHLSFGPVSREYLLAHDPELLIEALQRSEIELKAEALESVPWVFEKYIRNVTQGSFA